MIFRDIKQHNKVYILVTINVKDKQATYSYLLANNLVLATDQKDLIQMKTNAKLIIDTQKTILQKADKLLLELNPEQQNEQRFSKIEDSLSQIAKLMEKLLIIL